MPGYLLLRPTTTNIIFLADALGGAWRGVVARGGAWWPGKFSWVRPLLALVRNTSWVRPWFDGTVVWDPWLIVAQIVGIQCLYYLTLGAFLTIFVGTRVSRMSLVYFFDYATVTVSTGTGWCVIASIMLSSIAGAAYLLYLIERAKKCLDFSATVYIIHIFICIAYGGWPLTVTWWVVNGTGLAVMARGGAWWHMVARGGEWWPEKFSALREAWVTAMLALVRNTSWVRPWFYGTVVWDRWLIVTQIVGIQCLYYLTFGAFLTIFVGTRVSRMILVYFFDYATVTTSTKTGWCVIASIMLSSIAGAAYLLYLIERAKKCLDFSAIVYIIHLFICIAYGGWPSTITWWVVNGTGLAVMALLGEYLCIKRELREIPITILRSNV